MALSIASVPILTGDAADRFEQKLQATKVGTVDFSKEIAEARQILSKAKFFMT